MRYVWMGALVLAGMAGCSRAGERETVGAARDTVITPRQTEDTTIITSDTTVTTDTTVRRGDGAVRRDTTAGTVKMDTTRSQ
jgi:hypothetical protein